MTVELSTLGSVIKTAYEAENDTNAFTDAEKAKLAAIEAAADVTDATNVNAAGAVMESDYDANSILAATSDNTPIPVTVAEQTLLGRITAGVIAALTATQVRTLLNVEDGATADMSAAEILAALLTVDGSGSGLDADLLDGQNSAAFASAAQGILAESAMQPTIYDAHTILRATSDNTPAALTVAEQTLVGRITAGNITALTATEVRTLLNVTDGATNKPIQSLTIACSDESTALTTGTAKVTFRMPYAFTLTAVRASVTTAPTGSTIIIDINEKVGIPSPNVPTSILSTKLTIDVSEFTSTTAAVPAVISDSSLADDSEITIDIDQVGSSVAGAGLKVTLIGTRT